MTTSFMELSPIEARQRVDSQAAILVDIRGADEFVRSHIAGAHSHPLSQWETSRDTIDPSTDVIFMCRSGMRTASARDRLLANTTRPTFVLTGGIDRSEEHTPELQSRIRISYAVLCLKKKNTSAITTLYT